MKTQTRHAPHLILYAPFLSINAGFPHLLGYFGSGAIPSIATLDVTRATAAELQIALQAAEVVVIDQSVTNAATWTNANSNIYYHILDVRPPEHYREVMHRVLAAPVARVLLSNSDLHDTREPALQEWLAPHLDALFWLFEKEPPSLDEIPPQYREPWMEGVGCPRALWRDVARRFPVRVEAWFALAEEEVMSTRRRAIWQVAVPGAPYRTRTAAARSFAHAGLRQAPFRPLSKLLKGAGLAIQKTGVSSARSRALLRAHWQLQSQVLGRSTVSFVCGSGLRYPVRKFLEVPAQRSVLLAYPCVGLEDFGFKDGFNAVFTSPEDAGSAAAALMQNESLRTSLTATAVETVQRLHTVPRRAADLAECLLRLQHGTLKGAQFVEGRFQID